MADREHIPAAKKAVYLDKQTFATIMCMIPAGKLTTQEAICEMWARRKGADFCEIEDGGIMPFDKKIVLEARRCSAGRLYHRTERLWRG